MNNVEMDHPECYNNFEEVLESFTTFVSGGGKIKTVILNGESEGAVEVLRRVSAMESMKNVRAVVFSRQPGKLPEEIGIVAFDNYPLAEYTDPQLTIVDIDTSLLGEQAAQLLFQRIDSRTGNQQIMLSTVLVPRASSERKGRK